ncbi:unnamed protein product [Protopolystoma xenopodis]|uniref:Myosin motor domain-containing protein n=1 Tax=Protopolystoma xenopodis TaxID=117903 RepID=A0A448WY51_9PLAT|nr:unnamed protein product [Protopolystoma xenopodis]
MKYKGKRRAEMPPHIFSISDNAYHNMLQGEYKYAFRCSNSMLVSYRYFAIFETRKTAISVLKP